jgi:(1->4)-alpha-D-glucan 1-alpha-D-glucosylmutase
VHTGWSDPDEGYEAALTGFVRAVMRDRAFQADLAAFVAPLVEPGFIQSLAQTLVRMTAPGVPDIYQGTEAWDLSLVDPDNRRPVDYDLRRRLLAIRQEALRPGGTPVDLGTEHWDEGLAKVHVVAQALAVRRSSAPAFGDWSTYTPLAVAGPGRNHILAVARGTRGDPMAVVTVVPRLILGRTVDWAATHLELGPGRWADRLWAGPGVEGPAPTLGEIFERHTLALLERAG